MNQVICLLQFKGDESLIVHLEKHLEGIEEPVTLQDAFNNRKDD